MSNLPKGWYDPHDIFSHVPMKREGQAVSYDLDTEKGTFTPIYSHEIEVSFDPRDGEFQGADEELEG